MLLRVWDNHVPWAHDTARWWEDSEMKLPSKSKTCQQHEGRSLAWARWRCEAAQSAINPSANAGTRMNTWTREFSRSHTTTLSPSGWPQML